MDKKQFNKLTDALNRMDELIEEMGLIIEEKQQQQKDYNLLFDFIEQEYAKLNSGNNRIKQ